MAENVAPRQILQDILQGKVPARPLFAPIAFTLASRVENLPLRSFLGNATKISNALRQIHRPLRTDAVSCYFDPFLEAEALGATIQPASEYESSTLRWSSTSEPGQLPEGLASPDDVLKRGRMPVVLDVIRRLKTMLRDESLLMVALSGPLTLAARLVGLSSQLPVNPEGLPNAALEIATGVITNSSKAFAQAGANLVFLREEFNLTQDLHPIEDWLSTLQPILNIIRFYEALPVLHIVRENASAENINYVLNSGAKCVVCLPPQGLHSLFADSRSGTSSKVLAVALPTSVFHHEQRGVVDLETMMRDVRPVMVTSTEDLPRATDPKRVAALSELVRNSG